MMQTAKIGDTVAVEVHAREPNGSAALFNTRTVFKVGDGAVIAGVEEVVEGMTRGELRTAEIPAEKAFGRYDPSKRIQVKRSDLPHGLNPEVGVQLPLHDRHGWPVVARISEVDPSAVRLDMNHPLAGKNLQFAIRLLNIERPTDPAEHTR